MMKKQINTLTTKQFCWSLTAKRKIQEEISQKRLKIEEEKLKHQHLKVTYDFNLVSVILIQIF